MSTPSYLGKHRWSVLVIILFGTVFILEALASASTNSCYAKFKRFASSRAKNNWIAVADVHSFASSRGFLGFRSADVYSCAHCGKTMLNENQPGKLIKCAGCQTKFDGPVPVHRTYIDGTEVVHVDGIVFVSNRGRIRQSPDPDLMSDEPSDDMEVSFNASKPTAYVFTPITPVKGFYSQTPGFNEELDDQIDTIPEPIYSVGIKKKDSRHPKTVIAVLTLVASLSVMGINHLFTVPALERLEIRQGEVLDMSVLSDPLLGKPRFFLQISGLNTDVEVKEIEYNLWEKGDGLRLIVNGNGTLIGVSRLEASN